MKTAELTGAALDWAVAKCEGESLVDGCLYTKDPDEEQVLYTPSTDWAQGGPIIERENIFLMRNSTNQWVSIIHKGNPIGVVGHTPLIAAMRCHVSSNLGDEIEIPEETK